MLKNDYLVVKIGVDTAENKPSKVAYPTVHDPLDPAQQLEGSLFFTGRGEHLG